MKTNHCFSPGNRRLAGGLGIILAAVFLLAMPQTACAKKYNVTVGFEGYEQQLLVVPGRERTVPVPLPPAAISPTGSLFPALLAYPTLEMELPIRPPAVSLTPAGPNKPLFEDGIPNLPEVVFVTAEDFLAKIHATGHVDAHLILFDFESPNIRASSIPQLEEVRKALEMEPTLRTDVEGHTDNSGTSSYNQSLSQMRANSVRNWLIGHGVAASRLRAIGYGELRPLVPNTTSQNMALNRRAAFSAIP